MCTLLVSSSRPLAQSVQYTKWNSKIFGGQFYERKHSKYTSFLTTSPVVVPALYKWFITLLKTASYWPKQQRTIHNTGNGEGRGRHHLVLHQAYGSPLAITCTVLNERHGHKNPLFFFYPDFLSFFCFCFFFSICLPFDHRDMKTTLSAVCTTTTRTSPHVPMPQLLLSSIHLTPWGIF